MRVVVVSGDQPHHRHLALKLSESHEIAGIVHPVVKPVATSRRMLKLIRSVTREGPAPLSRAVSRKLPGRKRWNLYSETRTAELNYFGVDSERFEKILSDRVLSLSSVNSVESVSKIQDLNPQAIVSLGGAIYRRRFIEAFPNTINLHAGISPVYNGTGSIYFAFANGHFEMCGGTLMLLSEKIDGGRILAHALASIEPGDTPSTIFMKTIMQEADLVSKLLTDIDLGMDPISIPQSQPFVYTRSSDHTPATERSVWKHINEDTPAKRQRAARDLAYWREPDSDSAKKAMISTIGGLVCRS